MSNSLLIMNMITRESVKLFMNSNKFLLAMDSGELFAEPAGLDLAAPVLAKVAKVAFIGTAAEKAVESRRGFFGFLARAAAMGAV